MRGLSPLISAILLMMITVAAVGAAYLFITAMQSRIQLRTQESIEHTLAKGQISLEYVDCAKDANNKTSTITAYIKNVGSIDISVDGDVTITVTDPDTGTTVALAKKDTTITFYTGKVYSIQWVETNNATTTNFLKNDVITPGKEYTVKVTLPDGTYAIGSCVYE